MADGDDDVAGADGRIRGFAEAGGADGVDEQGFHADAFCKAIT
jgi:hypothetical protein